MSHKDESEIDAELQQDLRSPSENHKSVMQLILPLKFKKKKRLVNKCVVMLSPCQF